MCDAQNIIDRLKEIISSAEDSNGPINFPPKYDRASLASSCSSTSNVQAKEATLHYNTPVPSKLATHMDSQAPQELIPGCQKYEVRCKQTVDGNIAKPTVMCAADQLNTLYPPLYFGDKAGEYKPLKRTTGNLDIDLDQLECGMKNGFCPASRYEQFMAGKGGLPRGHPDNGRPEKFHHPFGMGMN